MGFPIGVLIGVSLAAYFLGANPHHLNRSSASLNCPGLETLPPEKPITVANTAPGRTVVGSVAAGFGAIERTSLGAHRRAALRAPR
jgi:hypothetical protein